MRLIHSLDTLLLICTVRFIDRRGYRYNGIEINHASLIQRPPLTLSFPPSAGSTNYCFATVVANEDRYISIQRFSPIKRFFKRLTMDANIARVNCNRR